MLGINMPLASNTLPFQDQRRLLTWIGRIRWKVLEVLKVLWPNGKALLSYLGVFFLGKAKSKS
jgi:hypothetical protein